MSASSGRQFPSLTNWSHLLGYRDASSSVLRPAGTFTRTGVEPRPSETHTAFRGLLAWADGSRQILGAKVCRSARWSILVSGERGTPALPRDHGH